MAEVLCLEPIGGIAGNMFLGLCVDLGVPLADLERVLAALPLDGWRFQVERTARHSIAATWLDVTLMGGDGAGGPKPAHGHPHPHPHPHRLGPPGHSHGEGHGHGPEGGAAPGAAAHGHRAWADIRQMLQAAPLSDRVKEGSLRLFGAIARAEARVHGVSEETVAFHEVGAVDSIVDVVGAAAALDLLGWPEVFCAPPPLGSGMVKTAHGIMPVPGPATLELMAGRAARFEGLGELTTPTGAGIVAALTREGPFPEMLVERVGYGAGTKDFPDRPNLLRGVLGRRAHSGDQGTWVLEANLDDASPQLLAWALERLLEEGALDVWIAPVTMKKGRPAHVLGVLAPGARKAALTEAILRETTSLGVRAWRVERTAAERHFEVVQTRLGPVRFKIGALPGRSENAAPEYEDCARLAREKGLPLKDVLAEALAAFASSRR